MKNLLPEGTRRSFFQRVGIVAIGLITFQFMEQEDTCPDWENGVELRKIYRDGKRVRMANLKQGDIFEVEMDSKVRHKFRAEVDASLGCNDPGIWGVMVTTL